MKSVLISIRPKWCELIASGEKTIEVRKTRPEIETPFKCYIYETKARSDMPTFVDEDGHVLYTGRGQVIGEFVCDRIYPIQAVRYDNGSFEHSRKSIFTFLHPAEHNALLDATRLENEKIFDYLGGEGKEGYAWHISDLEIYDKSKELSEFRKSGFMTEEEWLFNLYPNTHCHYEAWAKKFEITRPPQSWCYVEKLE